MNDRTRLARKRPNLQLRSVVLEAVRSFFLEQGFLEVQTPLRAPAPLPELHIDAVPADGWFLLPSPEPFMKRLLAAGYDKIFQISPAFRRNETGRLHHSEYTLLEWYRSHEDYGALQEDCRRLLSHVCRRTGRSGGFTHQGRRLEPEANWERLTVKEAFARFAGWTPDSNPDPFLFSRDLVEKIEPRLGFPAPCILLDYPAQQAALARIKESDPSVAERFELYWAGIELANGFSELTDAREQRRRFERVLEERAGQGALSYPMPERFLQSLEDLPPSAGIALGMDRLVMILADARSLDEVVAFPPDDEDLSPASDLRC
ncbi:MAG TPA: EF-P lysine aminoacylase EpmA [Syntrophobacteraceae bacterium]|nr:EF-P lysine aminoacylase EpmA [Syntrophobacteraceae bacterium]